MHKDKKHLVLRNNFRVTKKFLITKFDCTYFFRDNGIVISVSIAQWVFELFNIVFFICFLNFIVGYSLLIDKFFGLYNVITIMIIQPAFYLKGDETFRRNWANHGFFEAMKIAFC